MSCPTTGGRGGILQEIVERRLRRVAVEGNELSQAVPASRRVPVVPFASAPFLICEIKRRSPSRGEIAAGLNPVEQAAVYRDAGVRSMSVLTEEDYFGGSLADLMAVKRAFPDVAVLRKDFLVEEEDLVVSHRAGADAVLLIASLFTTEQFEAMHRRATELGLTSLVEVHDARDVETIRRAAPPVVGINSRDLATFTVDPLTPVRLRNHIDWSPTLVFESGVHSDSDVRFARRAGFRGVLVGESVTRDPALVPRLLNAFDTPLATGRFWTRLGIGRPLIKICGIAREDDGRLAAELGADILGFIFAPSPRRATSEVVERLADVNVPKVAVVAETTNANRGLSDGQPIVPRTVETLLNDGLLDAVQFHGDENPTDLAHFPYPSYKALRIRSEDDVALMDDYRTPRVLIDAFAEDVRGGSGKRIAAPLVSAAARKGPLWLAGGLNPENIRQVIEELDPELVDASSGLEARPGVKDEKKLERFFREIRNAQSG